MKPFIKVLASAGVCAFLATPAQADAQQITLSLSGVVEQGRDDLNLFFGSPGDVVFLGGETYTLSLTLDAADLDIIHATPTFADYAGAGVALSGALTMNGKTLSWTTEAASASVHLELEPDTYTPGERQGLSMRTTAAREPGTGNRDIVASHQVYTFFWPLLASTELNQEITFPEYLRNAVASSHFEATGLGAVPNLTTWFDARATSATWTVSAVPEPGQYGMLAAGLLAIGLAGRQFGRVGPQRHRTGTASPWRHPDGPDRTGAVAVQRSMSRRRPLHSPNPVLY